MPFVRLEHRLLLPLGEEEAFNAGVRERLHGRDRPFAKNEIFALGFSAASLTRRPTAFLWQTLCRLPKREGWG